MEQFEILPTKAFCCVTPNRLPPLNEETQQLIRKRLLECDSKTAIAKHRNRIENVSRKALGVLFEKNNILQSKNFTSSINNSKNQAIVSETLLNQIIENTKKSEIILGVNEMTVTMKDCCKKLYKKEIICENILKTSVTTKKINFQWKKERKYRITGSRCYSLYTYNKDNWPDKSLKYFWPQEFSNKYTKHGNKFESIARDVYKNETLSHIEECGLIISESEPWAAYSPDEIVCENSTFKLFEIKCPYELINTSDESLIKKCKFLCVTNQELRLKEKHQYYGQIQFGITVLNLKSCDFVIYSNVSNSIRIFNVKFNVNFARDFFQTLKKRYFEKMLHEICLNSRKNK